MRCVITDLIVSVDDRIVAHEIASPGAPSTGRHIVLRVTHVYIPTNGARVASVGIEKPLAAARGEGAV
jgi:hypothetical protein